jgi:hypothetical protein
LHSIRSKAAKPIWIQLPASAKPYRLSGLYVRGEAMGAMKRLIRTAWLEWLVSRQVGGGNGARYIPAFVEVPGWFPAYELGLALREGPSIVWTAEHLDEINAAHRAVLTCRELRKSMKAREQHAAEKRRREWRAMLRLKADEKTARRERARATTPRKARASAV